MKRLLTVFTLPLLAAGCSLAVDSDVRAYNACLSRHPKDAVICEGPRQAYEVGASDLPASAAAGGPATGLAHGKGTGSSSRPPPIPLHPNPMSLASAPNG